MNMRNEIIDLSICNVSKKYKDKVVLDNISLNFERGKCYMIVGANGSGKSTLVKIIIGLVRPTKGHIYKNNIKIGYVPEKYKLADYLKIYDYLLLLGRIKKVPIESLKNKIDYYLKIWKMYSHRNLRMKELSKGMMQKVIIIQAMINNPDLYIFDEALNGLDISMQNKLLEIIDNLKKENKMIIITSHYPKLYERTVDVVLKLEDSKVEVDYNN